MGKQKYASIHCKSCASDKPTVIKGTVECTTEEEFIKQEIKLAEKNGWRIIKHEEKRNHEPTRVTYQYQCPNCMAYDQREKVRFEELIEKAKKDYGITFFGEVTDCCGWVVHYKTWRVMVWGRGSGSDCGAYYKKEDAEKVAEIVKKSGKETLHNTKVRVELEEAEDILSLWSLRELYGMPLRVE